MASEAREIVERALTPQMVSEIWTANYTPVIPFLPQGYAVGAVLPMLLYLFRWGHRRGRGKFDDTFPSERGSPTVRSVSKALIKDPRFVGFNAPVGELILGDLLLTGVLENVRHLEGHDEQVQRCYAAHYMASWIDLPQSAGHLRGVPEAIVAIVANQTGGSVLEASNNIGRFYVGARVEEHDFLRAFAPGVKTEGTFQSNLKADRFDEVAEVGLDQLLAIRLAQLCGEAPRKAVGKGDPTPIPNQWPLARRAANTFREDFLAFFRSYGTSREMPRQALLPMLEAAVAIGMTTMLTSTVSIVERWTAGGRVPDQKTQRPCPVFVDASMSSDAKLREVSERSIELLQRRVTKLPAALMYMRLLDRYVRIVSEIDKQKHPAKSPDSTEWIDLLGAIGRNNAPYEQEGRKAENYFRQLCNALAAELADTESGELRADILTEESGLRFGERLAETLNIAYENVAGRDKISQFLNSSLMVDEPNGLARRRRITLRRKALNGRKTTDVISFVLTNTALEYLVHRHLRRGSDPRKSEPLSLPQFLKLLRERYGFYIDQSPPGMAVPGELLERNARHLERRLRDLGLLIGVNDAERMKKLRSRYQSAYDAEDAARL